MEINKIRISWDFKMILRKICPNICIYDDFNIKREDLSLIMSQIVKTGSASAAYYYAEEISDADIELLQSIVVKSDNVWAILDFAKNIKGSNKELLRDRMLEIGNLNYIIYFARDVKDIDITPLEDFILASNNWPAILYYVSRSSHADVERFQDAVLKTGNKDLCYYFAMHANNADIIKIVETLNKMDAFSNEPGHSILTEDDKAIINSNNATKMYNYISNKCKHSSQPIDCIPFGLAIMRTKEWMEMDSFLRLDKEEGNGLYYDLIAKSMITDDEKIIKEFFNRNYYEILKRFAEIMIEENCMSSCVDWNEVETGKDKQKVFRRTDLHSTCGHTNGGLYGRN